MKIGPILLAAAVLAIVAAVVLSRSRKPAEMPFPEMLAMLQKEAVSIAKDSYGITLDYSPASVEKVEEILGKLTTRKSHKTSGLDS